MNVLIASIICSLIGFALGLIYYKLVLCKTEATQLTPEPVTNHSPDYHDNRLKKLLDHLPDFVLKFNSQLQLIYYNTPAEVLISDANLNILDQTADGLTLSETLTRVWFTKLLSVLQTGQPCRFEFIAGTDENKHYYEVNAVPDVIKIENKVAIICVIRDITTRKVMEEKNLKIALEQQRIATITHLSNSVAHDIRTPLASIGTSTYILSRTSDANKQNRMLDIIDQSVKQIAKQLDNLLLMTRLDADNPITYKKVDCSSLLRQLATFFNELARDKGIVFDSNIAELDSIYAEYNYLRQALEHLLYNAVSYTESGGNITIEAHMQQEEICIKICDTGCGIKAEQLEHIFERFYRCDASRSRNLLTGGSGLGLAIAKNIITRHGGRIAVESECNVGTTFTVNLPVTVSRLSHIKSERHIERVLQKT